MNVTILNRKFKSLALMSFLSLTFAYSYANASVAPASPFLPHGFYLGAFGGGGESTNNHASQRGVAFFPPAAGGPLSVNARGDIDGGAGFGGLDIGYEWQEMRVYTPLVNLGWDLIPALELEGYYLRTTQSGQLFNPTPRLPEHDFKDTFPINTGVILIDPVVAFPLPFVGNIVYPYIGIGVGAAVLSINGADSAQLKPAEPGINHFNSNPDASDWTFAAQGKAGLRFNLTCNFRLLAEYRFLYLASTDYTFGNTVYPTHVPTSKWKVDFRRTMFNMGALGLEYVF